MLSSGLMFSDDFWRSIEFIDTLKGESSLDSLLKEISVSEKMFYEVCSFLKDLNYELSFYKKGYDKFIAPPKKIKLSLTQWLHSKEDSDNKNLELFKKIESSRRVGLEKGIDEKRVALVELALAEKNSLFVELLSGKKKEIFPFSILYIEDTLSLLGEDTSDKRLISHSFLEIKRMKRVSRKEYKVSFSQGEINEFIGALREMSGKEIRLILKLSSNEKFDLKPSYLSLGKPYITLSGDGDYIWAATVEVSEKLFEWLYLIRWAIQEVIEPEDFQEEFLNYCKEREKKVA